MLFIRIEAALFLVIFSKKKEKKIFEVDAFIDRVKVKFYIFVQ